MKFFYFGYLFFLSCEFFLFGGSGFAYCNYGLSEYSLFFILNICFNFLFVLVISFNRYVCNWCAF